MLCWPGERSPTREQGRGESVGQELWGWLWDAAGAGVAMDAQNMEQFQSVSSPEKNKWMDTQWLCSWECGEKVFLEKANGRARPSSCVCCSAFNLNEIKLKVSSSSLLLPTADSFPHN